MVFRVEPKSQDDAINKFLHLEAFSATRIIEEVLEG